VVGISPQDYRQDGKSDGPVNPLDGMAFQRIWESRAYELGEGNYMRSEERWWAFRRRITAKMASRTVR